MVVAQAKFATGCHHAVGNVTVGASGRYFKVTWQNSAGKANYDFVANFEIARSTDDAADVAGGNLHLTPANGLAVRLRLGSELEHLAHDQRARNLETV